MNLLNDLRLREYEQIVVSLKLLGMVLEPLAPELRLVELVLLDHGSHGAVEYVDAARERRSQVRLQFRTLHAWHVLDMGRAGRGGGGGGGHDD